MKPQIKPQMRLHVLRSRTSALAHMLLCSAKVRRESALQAGRAGGTELKYMSRVASLAVPSAGHRE